MDESNGGLREALQSIDPYELEEVIGRLWEEQDYEVTVEPGSQDRGIDIVAERSDPFYRKQVLQVKRYKDSNRIGSRDIRRYRTLYDQESSVDTVAIITTSGFSEQARDLADDLRVELVDGEQLVELLNQNVPELVEEVIHEWRVESDLQKQTGEQPPQQPESSNSSQNSQNRNEKTKYGHLSSRSKNESSSSIEQDGNPEPTDTAGKSDGEEDVSEPVANKQEDVLGRYQSDIRSLDRDSG
jgi:hypothetical protein